MKIPPPPKSVLEIAFWLSVMLLAFYIAKAADDLLPPDHNPHFNTTTAR